MTTQTTTAAADQNRRELDRIKQNLANSPEFKAGTEAYYDAFANVFPCTVLEVLQEGNGVFVTSGKLRIRCDRTSGPYKKGEELTVSGYHCFPRTHRIKRSRTTINCWYRWVK